MSSMWGGKIPWCHRQLLPAHFGILPAFSPPRIGPSWCLTPLPCQGKCPQSLMVSCLRLLWSEQGLQFLGRGTHSDWLCEARVMGRPVFKDNSITC